MYLLSTRLRCIMFTWFVVVLACVGFLISLYFSLVHYRFMAPDVPFLPRVCRLSQETCQSILSTPDARLLGLPNFLLGLFYYLTLVLLGFLDLIHPSVRGYEVIMMASLFTVFLGVYLTHSLFSKLRVTCVLCVASHVINFLLAVIFLALWIF